MPTATFVRYTFVIDGPAYLKAPVDLISDVSLVTSSKLWEYATSTLVDVPLSSVDVLIDKLRVSKNDDTKKRPADVAQIVQPSKTFTNETDPGAKSPIVVTVSLKRNQHRLPANRSLLFPPSAPTVKVDSCVKCSDTRAARLLLLDCGHVACAGCAGAAADSLTLTCPLCGFESQPVADFAAETGRKRVTRFVDEAAQVCNRTSKCVVCNTKEATGRCTVEFLNMCASCFEEHLPSGPLRATHKHLPFDQTNGSESILCANPAHRNLPVKYLCTGHGTLGCHMCIRETSDHASCNVVTADAELIAIASRLRTKREAEVVGVINGVSGQTHAAWECYDHLRRSYDELRREVHDRASALHEEIATQERQALERLHGLFTMHSQLLEQRITTLDALRDRASVVSAILDGHAGLAPQLLLHAEANGHLSLKVTGDLEPLAVSGLTVNLAPSLPKLFTVGVETKDNAKDTFGRVRTSQAPLSSIATAAAGKKADTATPAVETKKRDAESTPSPVAAGALSDASATRAFPLSKIHEATDATEDNHAKETTLSVASVTQATAGPKGTGLIVDAVNKVVAVVKLDAGKTVALLGGAAADEGVHYTLVDSKDAVVGIGPRLKDPTSAVYHPTLRTIVVCDAGSGRLVFYPEAAVTTPSAASSIVSTPEGAFVRPIAVTPHGEGLLVIDAGSQKYHEVSMQPSFKVERSEALTAWPAVTVAPFHLSMTAQFLAVLADGLHLRHGVTLRALETVEKTGALAVAAHPTQSIVIAAFESDSPGDVLLKAYGCTETPAEPKAPAETPRKQPGGRQRLPNPTVKLLGQTRVSLTSAIPSYNQGHFTVDGLFYDGSRRIAIVVRELSQASETTTDGARRWAYQTSEPHVVMVALPQ